MEVEQLIRVLSRELTVDVELLRTSLADPKGFYSSLLEQFVIIFETPENPLIGGIVGGQAPKRSAIAKRFRGHLVAEIQEFALSRGIDFQHELQASAIDDGVAGNIEIGRDLGTREPQASFFFGKRRRGVDGDIGSHQELIGSRGERADQPREEEQDHAAQRNSRRGQGELRPPASESVLVEMPREASRARLSDGPIYSWHVLDSFEGRGAGGGVAGKSVVGARQNGPRPPLAAGNRQEIRSEEALSRHNWRG